ncbi:MAG: GNAT family N-acetyltransferase [Gammaproteobacteria bacterium]|nr:GNAT family N-acetyltransferase [Gammaproteobacteria bacterium]
MFIIDTTPNFSDAEIFSILCDVYVDEGYTDVEHAQKAFEPDSVRKRGQIIAARSTQDQELAGLVILVHADTPAARLAKENESEIHLLCVRKGFRGQGLGRQLVSAVVELAQKANREKLILWTQTSMTAAQKLYESVGFVFQNTMEINNRTFKVYEKDLTFTDG